MKIREERQRSEKRPKIESQNQRSKTLIVMEKRGEDREKKPSKSKWRKIFPISKNGDHGKNMNDFTYS